MDIVNQRIISTGGDPVAFLLRSPPGWLCLATGLAYAALVGLLLTGRMDLAVGGAAAYAINVGIGKLTELTHAMNFVYEQGLYFADYQGFCDLSRLRAEPAPDDEWPEAGHDPAGTYYSPLADINRQNVARLGFAWDYRLGTYRGLEATPVMVGGVLYAAGNFGRVYALDAVSAARVGGEKTELPRGRPSSLRANASPIALCTRRRSGRAP